MALGEGRKGPYSTIYHDWIPKLFKSRRLGVTSTAVFMLLCERLEFGYDEDGNRFAFASYSRKKMSDVLGASEIAVKRATDHLKEAGIIEVYQSGRKGSATVYAIMPSTPWPDRETEPIETAPHAFLGANKPRGNHSAATRARSGAFNKP